MKKLLLQLVTLLLSINCFPQQDTTVINSGDEWRYTFGFDIRFIKSFGVPSLDPWRSKEYFVFSPIIRINY